MPTQRLKGVSALQATAAEMSKKLIANHLLALDAQGLWLVTDTLGTTADDTQSNKLNYMGKLVVNGFAELAQHSQALNQLAEACDNKIKHLQHQISRFAKSQHIENVCISLALLAVADSGLALLYWLGHSRIYQFRQNNLRLLTHDHSWIQSQIDKQHLTGEAAVRFFTQHYAKKDILSRAIGIDNSFGQLQVVDTQKDDIFLLCSDAISNVLTEKEMLMLCQSLGDNVDELATALLDAAAENNAANNGRLVAIKIP